MSNLKYNLEKNKKNIILAISIILAIAVAIGAFFIFRKGNNNEIPNDTLFDQGIKKADYIFSGDKDGKINLLKTETNEIVQSIELNGKDVIYSRDVDLEDIMAFDRGTFYKIEEKNDTLDKTEVFKTDKTNIKSFKYSDEYIVGVTDNEVVVVSIDNKKEYILDVKDIDAYTVYDNVLIYSKESKITSVNLDTKEENSTIDVGDKTESLFVMKDKIIAFNNFGDGKDTSTILRLKPSDLYIDKAYNQDTKDIFGITPDSDDEVIPYVDRINKQDLIKESHYQLNLDAKKDNKKRVSLISPENKERANYSGENTVSTKGYIYSNVSGKLTIFDLRGQAISDTLIINDEFFMPILK